MAVLGRVGFVDGECDGSGVNDGEGEEKNTGGTGLSEVPLIDGDGERAFVSLAEGKAELE